MAQLNTFKEQYEVSIDYKKADGYWVSSHIETVEVLVYHGINEKNNHDKAAQIIKHKFPNCRINSVKYC